MNHCRGGVGLTPPDEDCGHQESLPAGSIGLCGGSYCRRPHSARGKKEAGGSRLQICRRLKNRIANPVRLRLDKKEEKRNFTRNKNRTDYGKQRRNHPVPARQRSAAGSSSGRRDRVAQQATIVGIVRSRHKDNRQACEQCTEILRQLPQTEKPTKWNITIWI